VGEGVLVDQEPYFVTIDVPRQEREIIKFADYARELDKEWPPGALPFLVGMAPSGEIRIEDLARLPHLLVAGATGTGKSVFLRGIIASLVRNRPPETLQLLIVDPKQVDYLTFEDLPHLHGGRLVFDPSEAVDVLADTIHRETDRRRPILKEWEVTNVIEFYEAGGSLKQLPQIVVVIDEFADLGATLPRSQRETFMALVQRYGQVTRAFGIYLVLATQRPSVQVITGDIKANLTARVAFKVQAPQDSVTILGRGGAETLTDKGDLLFDYAGRTQRLQAFLTTPADARSVVPKWRDQSGTAGD
jgi:DNA segregation ATPase FtsK/SpoIIIE-like protein